MSWTTPPTVTVGQVLTAAFWNTNVRDQFDAAAGAAKAACRVFNSAVQSVTASTQTAITFNSERFDRQAMHSTSVNTSRITVPTGWAGLYLIGAQVMWAVNSTGVRWTDIRVNALGSNEMVNSVGPNSTSVLNDGVPVTTLVALNVGDYVEVFVWQNSGGALNTQASSNGSSPEFWAIWMSA